MFFFMNILLKNAGLGFLFIPLDKTSIFLEKRHKFYDDDTEACDTLEEISSQYNCLPLNSTLHTLYDKNHIYWDNDGKLCFGSNYSDKESDMFIPFKQINPEYLPLIQPFLKKRNSIVGNTTIQKPSYKKSF